MADQPCVLYAKRYSKYQGWLSATISIACFKKEMVVLGYRFDQVFFAIKIKLLAFAFAQ